MSALRRLRVALAAGLLALLSGTPSSAEAGCGAMLGRTWRSYRAHFVQSDGRVVDHKGGGISTSEGQTYALVRAVWSDDRASFDTILRWTRDNLQGGDPAALPAWRWGQRPDGGWGVLDPQPAADADQLLAWSLLLAAERWAEPAYAQQARAVLAELWAREVREVAGALVLLPGPWAEGGAPLRLNPSYALPFAWRSFATADPAHPWTRLLDDTYALLGRAGLADQLAPDWLYIDPATGARVPAPDPNHEVFGFEASRLAWTLAAELAWFDEPRARTLLQPIARLGDGFTKSSTLFAVLDPSGTPLVTYGHLSMSGAVLPAWALVRPAQASALAAQLRAARGGPGWGEPDDYYAQNWAWFGLALRCGHAAPPEGRP